MTTKTFTTTDQIFIFKWYPHFGGEWVAKEINTTLHRIRYFANTNKLRMLPRNKRLCIECKIDRVAKQRATGYYCRKCFNARRKILRRSGTKSMKERFNELLRSARRRSSIKCNIDNKYLSDLWTKQGGRCYYSGLPMQFSKYGDGRSMYSVSLDQIVAGGGYIKGNVVLCCWAVNAGKNSFPIEEYVNLCRAVVRHQESQPSLVHDTIVAS